MDDSLAFWIRHICLMNEMDHLPGTNAHEIVSTLFIKFMYSSLFWFTSFPASSISSLIACNLWLPSATNIPSLITQNTVGPGIQAFKIIILKIKNNIYEYLRDSSALLLIHLAPPLLSVQVLRSCGLMFDLGANAIYWIACAYVISFLSSAEGVFNFLGGIAK